MREVLDRLVTATQLRFPVVGDLARSVRFRWFDQPLVDAERSRCWPRCGAELVALTGMPAGPERTRRLDELAAIPEQIVRFLAERHRGRRDPRPTSRCSAVLIKRHYRDYDLHDLREQSVGGRPFAVADYRTDDRPTHLVTTIGQIPELIPGSSLVAGGERRDRATRPPSIEAVLDLYLAWPDAPQSPDEASAAIAKRLAKLPFAHEVRRVTVADLPRRRPIGRLLHLPATAGCRLVERRPGRGRPGPRRAPDGGSAADPPAGSASST